MEPDPDDSYFMNNPGVQNEINDGLVLNKSQKNMALQGKGILADLFIIGFEFVVMLWQIFIYFKVDIQEYFVVNFSMFFTSISRCIFRVFKKISKKRKM